MWPFIPWEEVDVSASIAAFSAWIAAGALIWNVWWSRKQFQIESYRKVQEAADTWADELRNHASQYASLLHRLAVVMEFHIRPLPKAQRNGDLLRNAQDSISSKTEQIQQEIVQKSNQIMMILEKDHRDEFLKYHRLFFEGVRLGDYDICYTRSSNFYKLVTKYIDETIFRRTLGVAQ